MTTHVFVVDLITFKLHLEYLFAGTGAKDNFIYQKRLQINFLTQADKLVRLKSFTSLYPLNLLFALLNFKAIINDLQIYAS